MSQITLHNSGLRYSLLFKASQAGAGILTIGLIAEYMDPVAQGYYYAFASLIALQSFFELGLYLVVSVSASHEWAHLRLSSDGSIDGNSDALSRLVSLGRFVFKWYGAAAGVFLLSTGGLGFLFFTMNHASGVDWTGPWLLHVAFSAGSLWLLPFLSLLEGCDRFDSTARFRLLQTLVSSAALWIVLFSGGQLWAMPTFSGLSLSLLLVYLGWSQRQFFASFRKPPSRASLSWRYDLFPMQWRLALQGLFSYLSLPLYPVLIFAVEGAVSAGRLGMSLQIVSAMQSLALVLMSTRAPRLAIAVAQRQHDSLDDQWRRACVQTMLLMLTLSLFFLAILTLANSFSLTVTQRLLPVSACAMLAAGSMLALAVQCAAVFMRAHKVEMLTSVGVVSGIAYGLAAWLAASNWGAIGVAASYLAITAFVTLPLTGWVFTKMRYKEFLK
jgi:O-antigen/teichoic acid export membrane protein